MKKGVFIMPQNCDKLYKKKQQERMEDKAIDFPDKKIKLSVKKILYVESRLIYGARNAGIAIFLNSNPFSGK
ncbi:MAG: hypothetical protein LUI12_02495 [Clostridiales bacterium]|nr:hypothetical protein [Clostridiales bacterium]